MSGFITRDYPFQVVTADGSRLYEGTAVLGMVYDVICVSMAVLPGHVIKADTTNTKIPRFDYAAGDALPLQVLKGAFGAAAVGPHLGVALTPCASNAAGERVLVAGVGSIVPVFRGSNTLTAGQLALAEANAVVSSAAAITVGRMVGQIVVIDITGGSGNMGGIVVNPQ